MRTARHGRAAVGFILMTVLLDTIGFGIIAPIMPALLQEISGQGISSAALFGGWLTFVYALMQFFAAPILGNLSDRFGRRPVLLFSLATLAADYVLMSFAPNLAWLFVGRVIAGIAGATHATANAYIADVTAPERRAQAFGWIGAAWGVGFILGPALGGFLGEFGTRVPFAVAAVLTFINFVYGVFVVPESLAPEKRRPFAFRTAHSVATLRRMRGFPIVFGMLAVFGFYMVAHDVYPTTWSYYMAEKFQWGGREIGWSLTAVGISSMIVQGALVGPIVARLGERRAALLGLGVMTIGCTGFALANVGWMIYVLIFASALGGVTGPALRTIMSTRVPENQQGELAGAISALQSFSAMLAPLLMTGVFSYFTSPGAPLYFPGASFLTASLLAAFSCVLFVLVMRQRSAAAAHPGAAPS